MRYLYIFLIFIFPAAVFGQSTELVTPNTGSIFTLDDLVDMSSDADYVTIIDGEYYFNEYITISGTDTLVIYEDAVIKVAEDVLITIQGGLLINSNTLFTKSSDENYRGFRMESGSVIHLEGSTFEYGGGMKVLTDNFTMIDCIVQYQSSKTATSGAVDISTGRPHFENCTFKENHRGGIGGPANSSVAPFINNCSFLENTTSNQLRPQINLGPSGNDTIVITNNLIVGNPANDRPGGIAITALSLTHAVIKNNEIRDNQYGITVNGLAFTRIEGNIIEDNNTNPNPMTGGSGINILGNGDMGHVVLNNEMRNNIWGITLQGNGKLNAGDIDDPDVGYGGNVFSNNGNGGVIYALYNNTPNDIMAQGNCWIEDNPDATLEDVSGVIFEHDFDEELGVVDYDHFTCDFGVFECEGPSDIEITDTTENSAEVSWAAVYNANSYEYYYATTDDEPAEEGTETEDTEVSLTDLEENTTYYVWVRSNCEYGNSEWEGPVNFTTDEFICGTPTDLTVDNITDTSAEVSWTPASPDNAESYEYHLDITDDTPASGSETQDTSVEFTELEIETTYYFTVRANCGSKDSEWSAPLEFTTTAVGLTEVELEKVASIYPNPVTDVLYVDLKDNSAETVRILDLAGRTLQEITLKQKGELQLDLSKYAAGAYIIQISNSKFISNGKFIIQ